MDTDMDEPLRQVLRRALSLNANPHVYTTHLLYEDILRRCGPRGRWRDVLWMRKAGCSPFRPARGRCLPKPPI